MSCSSTFMTNSTLAALLFAVVGYGGENDGENPLPPGSPPTCRSAHFASIMVSNLIRQWNLRDHGSELKLHSRRLSGWYHFCCFRIAGRDGHCCLLHERNLKVIWLLVGIVFTLNFHRAGFSPHEAHAHLAFFGWIMPTIRTSEFTVLQIVGLDAAVVCW